MQKLFTFLAACLLSINAAWSADQIYAVYDDAAKTMTLYYDSQCADRGGVLDWIYNLSEAESERNAAVKTVILDASMKKARPTSTRAWFNDFHSLFEIQHLDYLNTEKVTDMSYMFVACDFSELDLSMFDTRKVKTMYGMFANCMQLRVLDLSSFDFSSIENTGYMFGGCWFLSSIFCNADASHSANSDYMFESCMRLAGGLGTEYDVNHTDATYAHLDRKGEPGYFTSDKFYGVWDNTNKKLTLYYDDLRKQRGGTPNWVYIYSEDAKKVVFDKSVCDYRPFKTSEWFDFYTQLETIEHLDYLNTSEVKYMNLMFASCPKLTSIDLTMFNTSKVKNMNGMFYNSKNLQHIYCNKDWSRSTILEDSGGMFAGCTSLVGGNGTACDGENHVDASYARPDQSGQPGYFTKTEMGDPELYAVFNDATKSMTLYFDEWKDKRGGKTGWTFLDDLTPQEQARNKAVKTVIIDGSMQDARPTDMAYWFCDFNSLTQIQYIENLNTEEVTDMSYMFRNCGALEDLDLTHFKTGNVLYMDNIFQNCKALKSLDLRSFTTSNLVTTVYMFYGCSSLEKIFCKDDWSKSRTISSSDDMFYGCTSLKGGKGTAFDANHIGIEYAHPDEPGQPGYFWAAEYEIYAVFDDAAKTMTLYYDENRDQRGGILDWTYYDNMPEAEKNRIKSVKTIIMDASMKDARPTSTCCWFCLFIGMTQIQHLDYLNTEEVTDISGMFMYCQSLSSVDLSHFNTSNVINTEYMFCHCPFKKLDLSNFDTKNVTNMEAMFYYCGGLVELDLRSFDMGKVENVAGMFENCEKLKTIYCNADASQATYSSGMFKNCTSLVGGLGTVFDANHIKAEYARPDEEGKPGYFTSVKTGLDEISQQPRAKSQKLIRNGILLIERGNKTFNAQGTEVK